MNLQKSPNRWSCVPTAFAMAFGIKVDDIFKLLGHDGSEILFPELSEPYCRRAFHIQEMVDIGILNGFAVLIIESVLYLSPDDNHRAQIKSLINYKYYTKLYPCVLMGTLPSGMRHAVAIDHGIIYDPCHVTPYFTTDMRVEICCPVIHQ